MGLHGMLACCTAASDLGSLAKLSAACDAFSARSVSGLKTFGVVAADFGGLVVAPLP